MVHRDLHSVNIIVLESGNCQIIDFGHALVGHRCEGDACNELIKFKQDLSLA